jgi:uncharacterized protein YjbI with pentapeptide repeats
MPEPFQGTSGSPVRIQAEVLLRKEQLPGGFVNWMDAHKEAIGICLLIVAGLFTFYRYIQEEVDKSNLQRQTLLVQFYAELDEKGKRNTAAYALATLSGKDALPVLIPKFQETAQFDPDPSFLSALNQSFILIGEPALREVLRVNRGIKQSGLGVGNVQANKAIIISMQPTIVHFLRQRPANLSESFSHILLIGPDLSSADLSGLDFSGSNLEDVQMCNATLNGTSFLNATISGNLGYAKLNGAVLTGASFLGNLQGTSFDNAIATKTTFPEDLEYAKFRSADLTGVDLSGRNLRSANFNNARLANANFLSSDLESADFSGADLDRVIFGTQFPKFPPHFAEKLGVEGAFVRNANFSGAKHLNEDTRQYLCKWGARDIPGGCKDTLPDRRLFFTKRDDLSGGSGGGCW